MSAGDPTNIPYYIDDCGRLVRDRMPYELSIAEQLKYLGFKPLSPENQRITLEQLSPPWILEE